MLPNILPTQIKPIPREKSSHKPIFGLYDVGLNKTYGIGLVVNLVVGTVGLGVGLVVRSEIT